MSAPSSSTAQPTIPMAVAERAMHWLLELQEPQVSEQTRADWLAWRQAAHAFTLLTQLTATALLAHTAWTA